MTNKKSARAGRDDFKPQVKDLLGRRAGVRCSNPNCGQPTSGPQQDPDKAASIGVAAHIAAAAAGGPRHDPQMTAAERASVHNGIWLCQNCAKLIDTDVQAYPAALLHQWKRQAEETARRQLACPARARGNPPDHRGVTAGEEDIPSLVGSYLSWVQRTTATFTVPGMGVALPISTAWIRLQSIAASERTSSAATSLEQEIQRYHEWERLTREHKATSTFDAVHLPQLDRLIVVIGGPGAGKSTLLRRLAHGFCSAGKTAIRIRLPFVAHRMKRGPERFEDALVAVATDGSAISPEVLASFAAHPDYLLADGLDECDPYRCEIATALCEWAQGHPKTRIIVTTRPVAHDPGWFAGWQHAELLPLAGGDVDKYAEQILKAAFPKDLVRMHDELDRFKSNVKANRAASLAARNPLLLGFLIQLSLRQAEIGRCRAALYAQILELIAHSHLQDRTAVSHVDNATAQRCLDIFGWLLRDNLASPTGVVLDRAASMLTADLGLPLLRGKQIAEEALRFWEERRLLERISTGAQEAITFVHLSLAEFAAGRYIASWDSNAVREWATAARSDPKWREVMLLAAGAGAAAHIVGALLSLDDPADVTSTEAVLAASALAEAQDAPQSLHEQVACCLTRRLASDVPQIAVEAAMAAMAIAPLASGIVGPIARDLSERPEPWIWIPSAVLSLIAGPKYARTEVIARALNNPDSLRLPERNGKTRGFVLNRPEDAFRHTILTKGAALLLDTSPRDALDIVTRLLKWESISHAAFQDVLESLRSRGYSEVADAAEDAWNKQSNWRRWDGHFADSRAALRAVLEAALSATDSEAKPVAVDWRTEDLTSLGALLNAMGWLKFEAGAFYTMGRHHDPEAEKAVFRGAIVALDLDLDRLVEEVNWALRAVDAPHGGIGFICNLPAPPMRADWERSVGLDLDPALLVRAIRHPSRAIAYSAACLLAAGAGGEMAPSLLRNALDSSSEMAMQMIVGVAPHIFKGAAIDIVLTRLEGSVSRGCVWLLKALPKLEWKPHAPRIVSTLVRTLLAGDPHVATAAAEVMTELDLQGDVHSASDLRTVLEHWTRRGSWCDQDNVPVTGASCPTCHTVPPSPRPVVIRALAGNGALSLKELIATCGDDRTDVREAAEDGVLLRVSESTQSLLDLLERIAQGSAPVGLLGKIATADNGILAGAKEATLGLLSHPDPATRSMTLMTLSPSWLQSQEVAAFAKGALVDSDPCVRDAAVSVLRRLAGQTVETGMHRPSIS